MARAFLPEEDFGILDSPEQVLTTLSAEGKRLWIYPTESRGRYWRRRLVVGWLLIALFVLLPIVPIGGHPAVLLDVSTRTFYLFGGIFYPTDTFLLLLLSISILVSVVLITALLGRVWCGWACPQTVYLEFVFRPIERFFQGKEHVRKRRDEGSWTWDRVWRVSLTWATYLVIALLLAHVFVSYIVGWEQLITWMTSPPAKHWGYFVLMAGTTGLILFDFGRFREQFCTITCPYARLQSVLLDPDSLIVSYDPVRGEPRARRSKKKIAEEMAGERAPLGDCVDCYACVRTCPTGIDIRDGLQMECIACTQCIDACDDIMDAVGKPRGLIRYTSENALHGVKTRVLRPRTVVYGVLLVALLTGFTTLIVTRADHEVYVGRVADAPFLTLPDGRIANRLTFRVGNQSRNDLTFNVAVTAPEGAEVRVLGVQPVHAPAGQTTRVEVWAIFDADVLRSDTREATFVVVFSDGTEEEVTFPLLSPSVRS